MNNEKIEKIRKLRSEAEEDYNKFMNVKLSEGYRKGGVCPNTINALIEYSQGQVDAYSECLRIL